MEPVMAWRFLFFSLFFLASLFDLKYKKVPSIVVAPNLFAYAVVCFFDLPLLAVGFLAIFSILWFVVAVLKYLTNKVALNFVDILYLALVITIVKNLLVFLVSFTVLGYLFWIKCGKKEAPLLPALFVAMLISLLI